MPHPTVKVHHLFPRRQSLMTFWACVALGCPSSCFSLTSTRNNATDSMNIGSICRLRTTWSQVPGMWNFTIIVVTTYFFYHLPDITITLKNLTCIPFNFIKFIPLPKKNDRRNSVSLYMKQRLNWSKFPHSSCWYIIKAVEKSLDYELTSFEGYIN